MMFIGVLQLFAYKNENKDFALHKAMKWWITILVKDHGLKYEIGSIFAWTNSNHEPTEIPRGELQVNWKSHPWTSFSVVLLFLKRRS